MRSFEELERSYRAQPPAPRERGRVDLIVVRVASMEHETPLEGTVSPEEGLHGDRWTREWSWKRDVERQLTLMMTNVAKLVCDGEPLHLPGDNLLVDFDLGSEALAIGFRLRIGSALIEVTKKPHNGCKKFLARFGEDALRWVNDEAHRARKLRGINARVIESGVVRVGDALLRVG